MRPPPARAAPRRLARHRSRKLENPATCPGGRSGRSKTGIRPLSALRLLQSFRTHDRSTESRNRSAEEVSKQIAAPVGRGSCRDRPCSGGLVVASPLSRRGALRSRENLGQCIGVFYWMHSTPRRSRVRFVRMCGCSPSRKCRSGAIMPAFATKADVLSAASGRPSSTHLGRWA